MIRNSTETTTLYTKYRNTFRLFNNSNLFGSIYQVFMDNTNISSIDTIKYKSITLGNSIDTVKILDSKQSGIIHYYDVCKKSNYKSLLLT